MSVFNASVLLIDNEFRHNIAIHNYFESVMTKFRRTENWRQFVKSTYLTFTASLTPVVQIFIGYCKYSSTPMKQPLSEKWIVAA